MRKKILLSGLFLFLCFLQTMAQRTITGKVTTKDGTPLSDASVIVVGQRTGERTGSDGNFSIKVPANAKQLEISFVGYDPQVVSIVGKNNVSVSLETSATNLNAVVVTGYTSQRKKDITGSVSVVNVNEMKQSPAGTGEAVSYTHLTLPTNREV